MAAILPGCGHSDIDTRNVPISGGQFIIAGPGSRIISERNRFDRTSVLCTEPSPDVAKALASSGNASLSGGDGAASGSLGGGFTTSQTITKLDGRTAGVVALRDGLYYACQGYANGVIGVNTYALVLSEYSVLLGELLKSGASGSGGSGGDGAPSTGSAPAAASTGGVVLTVVGGSMNTGGGKAAKAPDGPAKAPAPEAPSDDLLLKRALLVSCIAENDPTRIYPGQRNPFLSEPCDALKAKLVMPPPAPGTTPARSVAKPGLR